MRRSRGSSGRTARRLAAAVLGTVFLPLPVTGIAQGAPEAGVGVGFDAGRTAAADPALPIAGPRTWLKALINRHRERAGCMALA